MYSILIQGPQSNISIRNIYNYEQYGEIVVSTWRSPMNDVFKRLWTPYKLVLSDAFNINYENTANIYKQVHTTLEGLKRVKTDFVIKVRSDEYYENLRPFIDKLSSAPEKLITSNTYFRPDKMIKFSAGDHIMATKTKNLLEAFKLAKYRIENDDIYLNGNKLCPEQILTTSYLLVMGELIEAERSKEIMKKHLDVVRVDELGEHSLTSNTNRLINVQSITGGIRSMEKL